MTNKAIQIAIFFICLINLLPITSQNILAQDSDKVIDVKLENSIQDPFDKSFFVIATITSSFTTQRADIQWIIPPYLEVMNTQQQETENLLTQNLNLGANTTSKIFIKIKPSSQGEADIKAVVRTYQADSRYLTTDNVLIYINDDLEIEPENSTYQELKIYTQTADISFKTTVILFSTFLILKIFQFILFKINPPINRKIKSRSDSKILAELEKLKNQSH